MIGRVLLAALLAGIAAGLVMSAVQAWKVTPLIIAAEAVFEGDGVGASAGDAHAHGGDKDQKQADTGADAKTHEHGSDSAWMPHNGFERTAATVLSNIIAGVAFALILTGVVIFTGIDLTLTSGTVLGLLGFCTFSLAPAAGLPPNLPGVVAGDLIDRQIWWWTTIVATGAGIWMIAKLDRLALKALGAVLILLPHFIGAPRTDDTSVGIPARMAAEFAANSLATSAVFWMVLGSLLGWLFSRQKLNQEVE